MSVKAGPGMSNRAIYSAALDLTEPALRQAYLDEVCGDDAERRVQIEQLLAAHAIEQTNPLDKVIQQLGPEDTLASEPSGEKRSSWSSPPVVERPGTQIGPYKIREQLGEGGMGVVYLAQQNEPVRRKVALKIIKPGMDTKQVIARFEAERQTLALMDHPNVAKVLDAGTTEAGRGYIVMELVQGLPITEYCDRHRLNTRQRLEILIQVCRAVQHAHQKGIIHRDLKPSNVLVAEIDGLPVPKVIDFGVAKATGQKLTEQTIYTQFSQVIGTPLYMSPEQAGMGVVDVDTRSDVYSLGVLTYELLTGSTPFDRETIQQASLEEMRRIICEDEPIRPSARISTLLADALSTLTTRRANDTRHLALVLRGELDWIVMKALEKDRNRRYESASALAADIRRYLDDERVLACPPSMAYRLRKYAKRHKGLLTTAALLLVTMIGGTAASLWYATKASEAAEQAKAAQTDAEKQADNANDLAIKAERAAMEAQKAKVREATQRKRAEQAWYLSDVRLAASQLKAGSHSEALDSLLGQYPRDPESDFRSWEWYYLLDQANQSLRSWQASESHISSIDWSPDGKRIATVSFDSDAAVWDAKTGEEVHRFPDGRMIKYGVGWHPTSHQLAWGSADSDGVVRIWDEESDTVEILNANTSSIWSVSWNHNGSRMAVGAIPGRDPKPNRDDRNFVIWKIIDGEWRIQARTTIPSNIRSTVWNFDDSLVAVACEGGYVDIYESETLKLVHQTPHTDLHTAHWHPSHNLLAFGTRAGECVIFDAEDFTEQTRFAAHTGELRHLQWSHNGERLASCGADGFVKIWNATGWSLSNAFSGHSGIVNQVSWHPDSERLASAGNDGVVNIWPVTNRKSHFELESSGEGAGDHFAWTTDHLIRTISRPASVVDRDPRTGKIERTIDLPNAISSWGLRGNNLAFRAYKEGAQNKLDLVTINAKNDVSEVIPGIGFEGGYVPNCINHDSTKIALNLGGYGWTTVFDLPAGKERKLGAEKFILVQQMAWSPDGKIIAIVGCGLESDDGTPKYAAWLHLADPATGADISRTSVGSHRVPATTVAWSPDSRRIAAATKDGTCEIFDSQHLRKLISRRIQRARVNSLSWHPDGARIASGGEDPTVNIWDSASGETILKLPVGDVVSHVEWSPDGRMLAAQEKSGTIRIWDATAGSSFTESKNFQERISRRITNDFQSACNAEDFLLAKQHGMTLLDREVKSNFQLHYSLGLLDAATEDNSGYVDICERMMKKFTDSEQSIETHFAAWTCALAADTVKDYAPAIKLARHAVEKEPDSQQYRTGLGAILMRSGQYEEAKIELEKALAASDSENTSQSYVRYFLAMTEQNLGNSEPARLQLQAANKLADEELAGAPVWNRRLTLELLRSEAQTVIGEVGN